MSHVRCGKIYAELRKAFPDAHSFAAGFIVGQAEKVYLGACPAAMFRPGSDQVDAYRQIVLRVCDAYGLSARHLTQAGEIWITKRENSSRLHRLSAKALAENHIMRAMLCGIPEKDRVQRWPEGDQR